nr:hypothetical protein [Tanacetum cinerariifolium]GEY58617.1 hypothetical protein [Tanacetum cinerariifolium]
MRKLPLICVSPSIKKLKESIPYRLPVTLTMKDEPHKLDKGQIQEGERFVNRLPEEWFFEINKDADDLEGILDYLEPAYEGPINLANEAYNVRRCKLLGMPYNEPPPILKEEAIMTRYDLGGGFRNLKAFIETSSTFNHMGIRACSKKEVSDDLLIMDAMLRDFLILILLFPI